MSDRRRLSIVDREQAPTPFGATLLRLCENVGAHAAALVDSEGETVDYAGALDPFEIRVAAAEWRLVLRYLHESPVPNWSGTEEVLVRSQKQSYAVLSLPEGYALVLLLTRRCFSISWRAVNEAVREISAEAGLEIPSHLAAREHWSRVKVRATEDDPRKPAALWVDSEWCELALLGRYETSLLENGEIGFRARLPNGAEINLVRERLGRWYAEDLPQR
jgi:hypothetical protein